MKRKYARYELGRWIGVLIGIAGFVIVATLNMEQDIDVLVVKAMLGVAVMAAGRLFYERCKFKELYLRERKRQRNSEARLRKEVS